jgi:hypothetical protein
MFKIGKNVFGRIGTLGQFLKFRAYVRWFNIAYLGANFSCRLKIFLLARKTVYKSSTWTAVETAISATGMDSSTGNEVSIVNSKRRGYFLRSGPFLDY